MGRAERVRKDSKGGSAALFAGVTDEERSAAAG